MKLHVRNSRIENDIGPYDLVLINSYTRNRRMINNSRNCIMFGDDDNRIEICNRCYGSDTFDCIRYFSSCSYYSCYCTSSSGGDPTSFLQSAKIHLTEATKDIKMGNSQAALTQINMTRQAITLAGLKLNVHNEGYCVAPSLK
jgi:hypothetical protein